jgi:hypothetical protein
MLSYLKDLKSWYENDKSAFKKLETDPKSDLLLEI